VTCDVPEEIQTSVSRPSFVRVFGPASLSNLGPGFDALGLCISTLGDEIEAKLSDKPGVQIEYVPGPIEWNPPDNPGMNTAVVSADHVLRQIDTGNGVLLRLKKGIPLGSGVGGSAASAVAGAWAVNALFEYPLTKEALVEAVLTAESVASGGRHGDNVLPALFGGLILVSSNDPSQYRELLLPKPLPVAVVLPEVEILTSEARAMLPHLVPLRKAVHNAADLAFLIDAFRCGDWEMVGACIMRDRLVEPIRARLVPCYEVIRRAALEAGAFGCAITGSGPAMFAVSHTLDNARKVSVSMIEACETSGIRARGLVTLTNLEGVKTI